MNIKIYAICLMTLLSGLLQASAPAASSVAPQSVTPEQELKNLQLRYTLYEDDSDETATKITCLLNQGARYEGNPRLFTAEQSSHPVYAESPQIMHALVNHSSTRNEKGVLWQNLQATFIRSGIDLMKELMKNNNFDINYNDNSVTALNAKMWMNSEGYNKKIIFLRFMGIGNVANAIEKKRLQLYYCQQAIDTGNEQFIAGASVHKEELEKELRILEMPQSEIHTLLTPEELQEYRALLLQRELGKKQNVLTYLTNRQMSPAFAGHQKAAQRRAQSLAAAHNEAQAAQHQPKKSHALASDDTERPSKKQKKDEEEKNN